MMQLLRCVFPAAAPGEISRDTLAGPVLGQFFNVGIDSSGVLDKSDLTLSTQKPSGIPTLWYHDP